MKRLYIFIWIIFIFCGVVQGQTYYLYFPWMECANPANATVVATGGSVNYSVRSSDGYSFEYLQTLINSTISQAGIGNFFSALVFQNSGDTGYLILNVSSNESSTTSRSFVMQGMSVEFIIYQPAGIVEEPEPEPEAEPAKNIAGNWVLTKTYTDSVGSQYQDLAFYDGLGYPEQVIQVGGSPEGKNMVTPIVYDAVRRADAKEYLPYTTQVNTMVKESAPLTSQGTFYTDLFGSGESAYAYKEKVYEASALNRVTRIYNSGAIFRSQGKYTSLSYLCNSGNEVLLMGINTSNTLTVNGYYPSGSLYKQIVVNEDQRLQNISYMDKNGREILKRSKEISTGLNYDTYYVYDDYGRLGWVVSPEGSLRLTSSTTLAATDTTIAAKYCYLYKYDGRGNMIQRQLPGRKVEYMEYDNGGRLIFSQDGNLREDGSKWMQTQYDNQGRITIRRLVTRSGSTVTEVKELIRNVYDSYSNYNIPASLAFSAITGVVTTADKDTRTQGLKVYEKIAVLDRSTTYVERAYYYDARARVIQRVACSTGSVPG